MPEAAKKLVGEQIASLEGLDIPDMLEDTIERHKTGLLNLACSLLDGGQNETEVRDILDTVFHSFRTELARTIFEIRNANDP